MHQILELRMHQILELRMHQILELRGGGHVTITWGTRQPVSRMIQGC